MAQTPEAKVKDAIKKALKAQDCWYYMPVPGGFGAPSLDFLCAYDGRMFAIEAKAPGKKPTARQRATMKEMGDYNIPCYIVDDAEKAAGYVALIVAVVRQADITVVIGDDDNLKPQP